MIGSLNNLTRVEDQRVWVRIAHCGTDLAEFALPHAMLFVHIWCSICEYVHLHGKRDYTNGINIGNHPALIREIFLDRIRGPNY